MKPSVRSFQPYLKGASRSIWHLVALRDRGSGALSTTFRFLSRLDSLNVGGATG